MNFRCSLYTICFLPSMMSTVFLSILRFFRFSNVIGLNVILIGLFLGNLNAQTPASKKTSTSSSSKDKKSTLKTKAQASSNDNLWAIPPNGSNQLVNFNQNKQPTLKGFDYDILEREMSQNHTFIEHHGYFRFRSDFFHTLDLGTYSSADRRGSSQYLPPLSDRATGAAKEDSASLASSNLRFRYKPTLHVNERLRVNAVMDLPDNLVMGSTPDGGVMSVQQRPDVALDGLSQRQLPLSDAFSLRFLWGTWETELARFDFGRMRHHWGLGMLFNGGSCLDCNFGDAVDRIQITTQAFDTYVSVSWDIMGEGPTGFGLTPQAQGQAWDWDQKDDVSQYTLSLSQLAISPTELAAKRTRLKKGELVFEWGVYGLFRHQGKAAAFSNLSSAQNAPISPEPEDVWALSTINLDTFTPDLYLSWTYHPKPGHEYSFKLEGAGMIGEIKNIPLADFTVLPTQVCSEAGASIDDCNGEILNPRSRDILSWGYVAEFDAKINGVIWGLHHGGASGDRNGGFFGANELDANDLTDQDLKSFRFNRDYIVDLILFREVLGGVYNAFYFKPYFGYELPRGHETVWGFKGSALYATAFDPQWTPGQEAGLGLELDLEAYIHQTNRFRASVAYGVLFPFSGLNLLTTSNGLLEAETAQTLQFNIGWMF